MHNNHNTMRDNYTYVHVHSLVPRPTYITALDGLHHRYARTLGLVHRSKTFVPVPQDILAPIRMKVQHDITNIAFVAYNKQQKYTDEQRIKRCISEAIFWLNNVKL